MPVAKLKGFPGPLMTLLVCLVAASVQCSAEEGSVPLYRVSKQVGVQRPAGSAVAAAKPHPLDSALTIAEQALQRSITKLDGYTAVVVKRERIGGQLGERQFMFAKIRNAKQRDDKKTPFSVYLKFLKPASVKGREVIYVAGQNKGKLIAHEGGFKGRFTPSIYLDPRGSLAMMGQRYPITDIGIENLCTKLIERGEREREQPADLCRVDTQLVKINKRPAQRIEITYPKPQDGLDFHIARIYVDKELGVPVRYEAYDWPRSSDGKLSVDDLIEEYTYMQIRPNPGLTDKDFDPANSDYNMK